MLPARGRGRAAIGRETALTALVEHCRELDIVPYSWANPNQSCVSAIFLDIQRLRYTPGWQDWFIRMPDTRSPYCGAYIPEGAGMDLSLTEPRDYWTQALIGIKERTGHFAYLWDSFYNSAFMPISYRHGQPRTMWRGVLQALKTMQDAGLHFMIESFGPFGEVQHGCPASYNIDQIFVCYKILLGSGYTTIPHAGTLQQTLPDDASRLYYILAHMSKPDFPLWQNGERIDRRWSTEHKRALTEYYAHRPQMHRRFLQEDGQGVLWHNAGGTQATLWNFVDRSVKLPGTVTDAATGETLSAEDAYVVHAAHTYLITDTTPLPTQVSAVATDDGP